MLFRSLVVPENVNYMSVEGVIYSKDMTKLVTYPTGRSMDGYVIPDSVTTIGAYALYSLPQLTEINIPDSVKHMEKGALSGLNQCKEISIGEGNPSYTSIDGVLYTKDLDTLIVYPAGKEEEKFQVPIGVRYIEEGAFANATYLKEIRLPSNLEGIGSFAFCYCEGLKTIEIPSEIMTCGESVFYGCKGISVFYRNTEYKDNQMVKDKLSMELRTAILQKK